MAGNILPKFQQTNTTNQDLNTVQFNLVRTLNPLFNTPIMGGNLLVNQPLVTGSNTINHGLGRNLNGWVIVRQRALANIFDTQDTNKMQNLTLLLTSSAPVSCDIYVF